MLRYRLLFAITTLLSAASAQATTPAAVILKNKPWGNNFADCDGVYMITTHLVNGKPIYINEQKSKFIGWYGHGWALTHTIYLDDVLDAQGSFGGYHFAQHPDITSGWSQYDAYGAPARSMNFDPKPEHELAETMDTYVYNYGNCDGRYSISDKILNEKIVYIRTDGAKFVAWSGKWTTQAYPGRWVVGDIGQLNNALGVEGYQHIYEFYDGAEAADPFSGWSFYNPVVVY